MKRICKQCGKEFVLTQYEIDFYQRKNLHLPKRCAECRRENKAGGKTGEQMQPAARDKNRVEKETTEKVTAGNGKTRNVKIGNEKTGNAKIGNEKTGNAKVGNEKTGNVKTENTKVSGNLSGMGYEDVTRSGQSVSAYYGKENGRKKPWTIVAAFLLLLAFVMIGSRLGFMSDQDDGTAQEQTVTGEMPDAKAEVSTPAVTYTYNFRKAEYLQEHFDKHGAEFGYTTAEEYLAGANRVIASPDVLHKLEAEDGDDVYYLEAGNEFVIVSTDGFLRTYFKPEDGKAYFDRQ